ncbi:mannitol-1-phosphate 5-dehydrogenase [Shouchella clausii]|uniref:Mannitol-1-phosphate 5-dehydrogenase n=1 Tax=Shouchella clausii TaxID=79880 RepID=A0A268S1F9_SHOCL|nr:mannitol-1-phosphate 5-dehydrogenase [Shouchella clausii]PAD41121.1 mannitol-1-phosphate 5-dehydrogenase [Bacillus sp. 7520-S]AST98629.1 mannitol-1-phosphate 5-dehydrogenase [Shouchella clausii]MBU8597933.1 mannitol-1-phosphate 5-dehydrogenase [Shouchella clausii]MEB5471673.1 mannitol-1-phosphate 5-dehydrogenase [Shouchella clausii]MEB5482014.1 mannitol-1-phosphate 5-dehydrogenase [Shouchella clausii]
MKAVHFGAGNIGRGFIGALLVDAGYEVTFVDVNEKIIDALNERNEYEVTIAGDRKETETVTNVRGINSKTNEKEAIDAIAEADIVTTAVGPTVLPYIAKTIAQGLKQRTAGKPVNIIACENAIRATSQLKKDVLSHLSEEETTALLEDAGFADAAVDRIVPNVQSDDILHVTVEPFFEWVVEKPALKGDAVQLGKAVLVDDLAPYIERKLFTVNTGHAVAAYVGYRKGKKTIKEALADDYIKHRVRGALNETKAMLVEEYQFDAEAHEDYIDKILLRFQNPHLEDLVERVGRGPIRKLGPADRLVKPAKYLAEKGLHPESLAETIFDALHFYAEGDPESEQLRALVDEKGYVDAFCEISKLEKDHPLVEIVAKE